MLFSQYNYRKLINKINYRCIISSCDIDQPFSVSVDCFASIHTSIFYGFCVYPHVVEFVFLCLGFQDVFLQLLLVCVHYHPDVCFSASCSSWFLCLNTHANAGFFASLHMIMLGFCSSILRHALFYSSLFLVIQYPESTNKKMKVEDGCNTRKH